MGHIIEWSVYHSFVQQIPAFKSGKKGGGDDKNKTFKKRYYTTGMLVHLYLLQKYPPFRSKGSIITVLSQPSHQHRSSLPAGGISAHNTAVTSTALALFHIPHKNTKLCTVWPLLLPGGRNYSWFVVEGRKGAEAIKKKEKNGRFDGTGQRGVDVPLRMEVSAHQRP